MFIYIVRFLFRVINKKSSLDHAFVLKYKIFHVNNNKQMQK